MKPLFISFALLTFALTTPAQDCIDPSLIDPNAICPQVYAPVCGCDGVTYDNDCYATYVGGVTSWTDGPCQSSTCMDMSQIDFGMCDMFLGYAWTGAGCTAVSGCGYIVGDIDYSPNFFQDPSDCQSACGDPLHDCINWSQIELGYLVDCAPTTEFVCGCNGVTYNNNCEAYFIGGVTTYALGNCEDSLCFIIPPFVDFGDCAMPLGYANNGTGCVQYNGCSYIGQNGYDYSGHFFDTFYECSGACSEDVIIGCVDSTQIDINVMCIAVYEPVCGCNNITYSNSCEAFYHGGVTSWTPGECTTGVNEMNEITFSIYPNPAENVLRLITESAENGMVRITDVTGRIVSELTLRGKSLEIDLTSLTPGVYQISLVGENNQITTKHFIRCR